jgi:hypothetical protein
MNTSKEYTAFAGFDRIAAGDLETVSREIRGRAGTVDRVLVFDNETGEQVDIALQGSQEMAASVAMPPRRKKGPGRPRLGVTSREISLLPRHWEWLERQPRTASATLRRLVETARKNETAADRIREKIEAVDRFMWAIAGNLAGFEEAGRALYAQNWSAFDELVTSWPPDIREHLNMMLRPVREPDRTKNPG